MWGWPAWPRVTRLRHRLLPEPSARCQLPPSGPRGVCTGALVAQRRLSQHSRGMGRPLPPAFPGQVPRGVGAPPCPGPLSFVPHRYFLKFLGHLTPPWSLPLAGPALRATQTRVTTQTPVTSRFRSLHRLRSPDSGHHRLESPHRLQSPAKDSTFACSGNSDARASAWVGTEGTEAGRGQMRNVVGWPGHGLSSALPGPWNAGTEQADGR